MKLSVIFLLGIVFTLPQILTAATLSFSPSSTSQAVGDQFSINLITQSPAQAMNAVSARLAFSSDTLELTSITTNNSIIDFWAQQPSRNNVAGTAQLEGVVFNGYQGGTTNVATLNFRAKQEGTGTVRFSSGDVLANDGIGTSIVSSLGTATIAIGPADEEVVVDPGAVLIIPIISSPTHPEQEAWYSNNDPIFQWTLVPGVIDVDVVTSRDGEPEFQSGVSQGLISELTLTDEPEGTSYAHALFRTDAGWGEVATFKYNIDTVAPEYLSVQEIYRSYDNNGRAQFAIEGSDATSGIKGFAIAIDGKRVGDWFDEAGSGVYETPQLRPGMHTLLVEAVDYAGNRTLRELTFTTASPDTFAALRDYIEMGLILFLFILVMVFFWRYRLLVREYHTFAMQHQRREHKKILSRSKRRVKKQLTTIKQTKKELSAMEESLQEVLEEILEDEKKIKEYQDTTS